MAASPSSRPARAETTLRFEQIRTTHKIPALAAIVVKNGAVVERVATGVRKLGDPAPLTIADKFHIGSCTKSMTATLAAILVEDGTLAWSRTVGEAFPEMRGLMDPQYAGVTLRQLLAHRGGVPGDPPPEVLARAWQEQGTPVEQRREFAAGILTRPPQAAPGTAFIYSNQGYLIAGVMLERAAGKPWETLMRERIFAPLDMASAGFGSPASPSGLVDQPWGHHEESGVLVPSLSDNPPAFGPSGRVHASLDDLARYALFHLRGDRALGRKGLLTAASLRVLHTPRDGEEYAFGWGITVRPLARGPALMHSGSNTFWYLTIWLAPARDYAVIVGTNAAGPAAEKAVDLALTELTRRWLPDGR